jgi:hypothetical protein
VARSSENIAMRTGSHNNLVEGAVDWMQKMKMKYSSCSRRYVESLKGWCHLRMDTAARDRRNIN